MQEIYLDANASCPPLDCATEAIKRALGNVGNPSSPHAMGRRARIILDHARESVASALGGQEKEIFFTSGATEGNRWLIDACGSSADGGRRLNVVSSLLEHPSVLKPLLVARDRGLISLSFLPLLESKIVPGEVLHNADVVFITAAHNETGLITDFSSLLAQIPEHTIVLSDATQSATRSEILPERIDGMIVSAHKMGAYPGIGAVLLRNRARDLLPPWSGGGQESGLRPGTEALHLIAAFGAVARLVPELRKKYHEIEPWRDEIEATFANACKQITIIGKKSPRLPNTSALIINGVDGDALRILIDAAKVCVGFGSACSALAPEPSPALIALGLTPEQAKCTIRLSLHPYISRDDLKDASSRLLAVFANLLA